MAHSLGAPTAVMARSSFLRELIGAWKQNSKKERNNDEPQAVRNFQRHRTPVYGRDPVLIRCATGLCWSASQRYYLSDNCAFSDSRNTTIHRNSERQHQHSSNLAGQWSKWRQ